MNAKFYRQPHFVYLLQGEGTSFFKIGLSRDAKRRAAAIQVPFDLILVKNFQTPDRYIAQTVEQGLHQLYADRRVRGEWFRDIDVEHFIDDAEYLSINRADIAQEHYTRRHPKKPVPQPDSRDKIVLETLKSEGYDAAMKVRRGL